MAKNRAANISQHHFANFIHHAGAKIAAKGQNHGNHRCCHHRAIKQGRVAFAKPFINKIGKTTPHSKKRTSNKHKRQNGKRDSETMRLEIGPKDGQ